MKKIIDLSLLPHEADDKKFIEEIISSNTSLSFSGFRTLRRSIDARRFPVRVNLQVEIFSEEEFIEEKFQPHLFREADKNKKVIIVGAGPAGLFAALRLLQSGIKPIIIERGKPVRERRRDIAILNKQQIVNPESNYCFGEGGAGTYSDGKLYTRSSKRGNVRKILELFVQHGASENILIESHPHIGTNKLPGIIERMRETILNNGGEIYFNSTVTDFELQNNEVQGVKIRKVDTHDELFIAANKLILATGHSARDIFRLLYSKKILLEPKPFAMGVRVEHPQSLIDKIQYHCRDEQTVQKLREHLPAASYSLVQQTEGRGVYSFCMCPGGIIAPCATDQNQIVVNGWSPSKRNNSFANSGMVVNIEPDDLRPYINKGVLAGIYFQQHLEELCWKSGGEKQIAPAQRLVDFVCKKFSSSLPSSSYQPGTTSVSLNDLIPEFISKRLREGFISFGKKMKGYMTNDAVLLAVESRTSSPIRIPRDTKTFEHVQVKGLYPIGEGAGYAGGIMSAAIDGERCGEKISELFI